MNRQQRRAAAAQGANIPRQLQEAARLLQAGNAKEAERLLQAILAADKRNPDALHLAGVLAYQRGQYERAAELAKRALAAAPNSPLYWNTLGGAQRALGRFAEARDSFRRATELAPDYPVAHANLGLMLHELGPFAEAERAFRRALALAPNYAPAAASLGALLADLRRDSEAADALRHALALSPGDRPSRLLLGRVLLRLQRHVEAAAIARELVAATPDDLDVRELLVECRVAMCETGAWADAGDFYRAAIAAGRGMLHDAILPAGTPGLARAELLALNRAKAQWHAARAGTAPVRNFARREKPKLKVGYLSGDFGEHPVAHVTAELFECHDRGRFEIHAYSTGPDDGSPLRARLMKAFDAFADIRDLPVRAAANAIAADGIDLLVDLAGYTRGGAPEILVLRPAPIRVSFLGYPGTLGGAAADYLLADATICPPAHTAEYAEAIARLPDCYMPNDRRRAIAPAPSRAELGLPEDAFVFCCFNNSWKITPAVFDAWMRLLAGVPGSILWLRDFSPAATRNLRAAAAERGLGPDRVLFTGRADYPAHLARMGRADLFLDTLPYNAHATANDALWAGLPVLTCAGETFASRVGASMLKALDLPELITADLAAYEARARELALGGTELAALRARLAASRETAPLFDAARFARNLEAIYERMWQRHVGGLPPAPIDLTHDGV